MVNRQQAEPKIWNWRVRARSIDSQIVTLGKYDTEDEAKADRDKIVKEGYYRNVRVEQIKPKPVTQQPAAVANQPAK
ncbi:MAG: hypothetical protein GX616_15585 [Planctomycetes bacterium]|nr:hypothetical protein [Planctomycetota bacterium]